MKLCTHLCTCEGEECGTAAAPTGNLCGPNQDLPCNVPPSAPQPTGTTGQGTTGQGTGTTGTGTTGKGTATTGKDTGTTGKDTGTTGTGGKCSSGIVNEQKNGCLPVCSFGDVTPDRTACVDKQATFESAGTFSEAGTFPSAAHSPSSSSQTSSKDGGNGAVVVVVVVVLMVFLGFALLLVGLLYYKRQIAKSKIKTEGEDGIEMEEALPRHWESYVDESSGLPVYYHVMTGQQSWTRPTTSSSASLNPKDSTMHNNPLNKSNKSNKSNNNNNNHNNNNYNNNNNNINNYDNGGVHGRSETELPVGWGKDVDVSGNSYYYDQRTGSTSWVPPPGSTGGSSGIAAIGIVDTNNINNNNNNNINDNGHGNGHGNGGGNGHGRSETVLPAGWEKEVDENGSKYYYDHSTGDMSWDAPPGATGGSSGM